mmetsp:Transcript_36834/g.60983  ORF Transcript_36834/g.60983 Transcript_36834/m.60983 type:complete len:246 (-) Transcript_36834:221-958(-)
MARSCCTSRSRSPALIDSSSFSTLSFSSTLGCSLPCWLSWVNTKRLSRCSSNSLITACNTAGSCPTSSLAALLSSCRFVSAGTASSPYDTVSDVVRHAMPCAASRSTLMFWFSPGIASRGFVEYTRSLVAPCRTGSCRWVIERAVTLYLCPPEKGTERTAVNCAYVGVCLCKTPSCNVLIEQKVVWSFDSRTSVTCTLPALGGGMSSKLHCPLLSVKPVRTIRCHSACGAIGFAMTVPSSRSGAV